MKQLINIGNVVDDGHGDYLRKGGEKINENFDELYTQLGDGETPHAAGAWKTFDAKNGNLSPKFGESFAINTFDTSTNVILPKGTTLDYNKVIKLRDVWNTWGKHGVKVVPASGDTMKGKAETVEFTKNLQDLELVYCAPGRWEYAENRFVNKISSSELSTVVSKQIIATEGQRDFLNVFGANAYNIANTNVQLRGNTMFYGENNTFDKDNADYGSPDGNELGPLDGNNIRLRKPCSAGDVITITSYLDGIGSWKSSYNKKTLEILDVSMTNEVSVPGQVFVADLSTVKSITMEALGIISNDPVNPNSMQILLNGRELISDTEGLSREAYCSGADGLTASECLINGGIWVSGTGDYTITQDDNGIISTIEFNTNFEHKDVLVVKWFNNNIGTLMEIDDILEVTDNLYLQGGSELSLSGLVEYSDTDKPSQSTLVQLPDNPFFKVSSISDLFDIFQPIGTIYQNAHNPSNPRNYMGMGTWVRYAEGRAVVGWNSDINDKFFALNTSDIDDQGNPRHTSGGIVGQAYQELIKANIPGLESNEIVLIKDPKGGIVIGGCQYDPDEEGPGYDKYREDKITINTAVSRGLEFEIIQPSITAHTWIRVA